MWHSAPHPGNWGVSPFMDTKEIKKIIQMMKDNDLSEFELEEEGFRIAIKCRDRNAPPVVVGAPLQPSTIVSAPANETDPLPQGAQDDETKDDSEGLHKVVSPMVGTFYRSPAPDLDPFVSVGSEVEEDQVVCIVEAMKVMNEIHAEMRGVIRKVLVENATPVQFGQTLFLVEPA